MSEISTEQTLEVNFGIMGGWLPKSDAAIQRFLDAHAERVKAQKLHIALVPEVQELKVLIKNDSFLRMGFTRAINEALLTHPDMTFTNIDEMIVQINGIMNYAPPFVSKEKQDEMVGCPLNAILVWLMCTPAGFSVFRSPILNAQFKKVLNRWSAFLSSSASCGYLTENPDGGWLSPTAQQEMNLDEIVTDPSKPHWGFTSWNDFFTRQFKPGERPVYEPDNNKAIVNACESAKFNLQYDVKLEDDFWIKSQPYSLKDIFTPYRLDLAKNFEGGVVYQAFLSAYNFHRWHAPVSGRITDAYVVDGTYYSDDVTEGQDAGGPDKSQGYLSAVATRAVIVIECDDPSMGKVACVFIGMAEVSSCKISALVNQPVEKGQEIGYFQFGGSTHCLIFEKDVIKEFNPDINNTTELMKVNSYLATAN